MKVNIFLKILAVLLLLSSCNGNKTGAEITQESKSDELTRDSAKIILNKYFSRPMITKVEFIKDTGIQLAIKNEFVFHNGAHNEFTGKSKSLFSIKLANQDLGYDWDRETHYFTLKDPITEYVKDVSGITDGLNNGSKIVEIATTYNFPEELNQIKPYIYIGRNLKVQMQKYDDGWRVMPESVNLR